MSKSKRRRPKRPSYRPLSQKHSAWPQEQVQNDYDAFKQWIASGEADKPITPEELNRMLQLAAKIK